MTTQSNKPILDIMVDLETMSKKENAAILSWAMVPFFRDGSEFADVEDFYRIVSLTSCAFAGMDIDRDTQEWWLEQDPKAKSVFLHGENQNIHGVACEAYSYLENLSVKYDLYLWARGIDFDVPKMEWCFRKFVDRPLPYKYSHKMDVRTVLKFMGVDQSQFEFKGVKHNSIDDCMHDIRMIQEAYKWKEKRMMAYTAMEAGKTAKSLEAEHSEKEAEQEGWLELPELGVLFDQYYAIGSSVILYRDHMKKINNELRRLNTVCSELSAENEELNQQLKDLQAKG